MKQNNVNVCLIQLSVIPYNYEANKNKIKKYINKVMSLPQKPDIIVLPEMWNIGFTINKVDQYCDKDGIETKQFLKELANKHKVMIIGGSVANYDTQKNIYQNLNININSEGQCLSTYAKVHLFSPSKEQTVFTRGNQYKVTSTTFSSDDNTENENKLECIFSSVICYDIRFPEFIRSIALEGINLKNKLLEQTNHENSSTFPVQVGGLDILFVSAAWPYPRLSHWKHLLITRAIENQCFVVAVNNCGEMDGLTFCGHSLVINPWGEVLVEGSGPLDDILKDNSSSTNPLLYREIIKMEGNPSIGNHSSFDEILFTSLSFDILKDIRQRICVFNDRFPEIYHCN
ncbi:carbon-nitrogen hydrolase [Piromyces finnis]|uniref:Carbon-nitrogen hydrolase n=1 Tax=Piromyces finnis TaxID=1754191 RepID=A0A1Y1V093_9FUNG|nr:carbon-nitrogen hydrolase [Piromyces finnis]|eukprot:ORX44508.1 carbon-nitrogen hydrolase [Piromyces finnis]